MIEQRQIRYNSEKQEFRKVFDGGDFPSCCITFKEERGKEEEEEL